MFHLWLLLRLPLCLTNPVDDPPVGTGVDHHNYTIPSEWEKLFSAGHNMTVFYKTPTCGYGPGHELLRTAIIFIEQMEELEKAVDENRAGSMDALWELYIRGGPLHLRQIPYDEFIRIFKWDSDDIDEYSTIIADTRRVWARLVEELERVAPKDIII